MDGQTIDLAVDEDAQVKRAAEHRLVGRSLPRPDIPAKDTRTFMFTQNVRVPGMVHARMMFLPGIGSSCQSSIRPLTAVSPLDYTIQDGTCLGRNCSGSTVGQTAHIQANIRAVHTVAYKLDAFATRLNCPRIQPKTMTEGCFALPEIRAPLGGNARIRMD